MRAPSNAQAALLALIAEHEEAGRDVEWKLPSDDDRGDRPSRARLYIEVTDRAQNVSRFQMADGWRWAHRVSTVRACLRHGWLADLHQRTLEWPARKRRPARTWKLRQLDLTEDGVIALGLWRERKLNAGPAPLPILTTREREIVELAHRAHELGYALCACKPARVEARRMRRAGWFGTCWVANSAMGLVPTPTAIVEIRPDLADQALVVERDGATAS